MKLIALVTVLAGLIMSLKLVDSNPTSGLIVYASLAALLVGLAALEERRAR